MPAKSAVGIQGFTVLSFAKGLWCGFAIPRAAILLWRWNGVAMICDGLQKQTNKRTVQTINQTSKLRNKQTDNQTHKQTNKHKPTNTGFRVSGFRVLVFRVLGFRVLLKVCGVVLLFRARRFCYCVGKALL